ncbi:MAG: Gx transporter family protein [Oscillospiraceae bacterium]|nr:Gx transporter family protein [Oscillospiraceae bacterium]
MNNNRKVSARNIVFLSVLTAISLALFVAESQIPPLTPFPGIKLGLANTVTLFLLYRNGKAADAVLVVTARVLLAGLVTANLLALLFSFCGGLSAVLIMGLCRRTFGESRKLIPVTSVAGGITHNTAQTVAAVVISGTGVLLYFPVLILGGILSGLLTGITVTFIIGRGLIEKES